MTNDNPRYFHSSNKKRFITRGLFLIFLFLLSSRINAEIAEKKEKYHIAIIHSYDENFPSYNDFNKKIKDEFKKDGINSEIRFFYLDSERYTDPEEFKRCYNYIESIAPWKPDLIITNGDQATYALLSSGHSLLKTLPILFSGVNFPRWKLYNKYPNVTGIWDKPDYLHTVEMIEDLLGSIRIRFFYDNSYLASEAIKEVAIQLEKRAPETHEILIEYLNSEDSVIRKCALGKESSEIEITKGEPDSTKFYFTNLCKERGRDVLWAISGYDKHSVFVITKYDYRTMNVGRMSSTPVFSVINEGFGYDRGILGGYMTTLDSQTKQIAIYAAQILLEKNSSLQITESKKTYVLDYNEMTRWGISPTYLPAGYEIINLPFRIAHRSLFIAIIVLLLIVIGFFIIYPLFLYLRELKRKKVAQKELIREKKILSLSLEKSNIYSWKYMDNGDIFLFDKELFENLGIPFTIYTLKELSEIIHPDDTEAFSKTFSDVKYKNQQKAISQCRCRFTSKEYIWYEFRYVNPSDEIKGSGSESIIGIISNIQYFKEREKELTEAKELAAQAELKQSFLANMSHEIRTPLNAIVGFSNLLVSEDDLAHEDKYNFISTINNNCDLLLKLINDILELSRIESGNMIFSFAPCNLKTFISDIYAAHIEGISNEIEFIKEIPDKPYYIKTDINKLSQVIINLLNNAIKFTETGQIKLGYTVDSSKNEISIYVEDTGKGIPEKQQKMIFERFYKQDEFAQGTGLGLSISMIIVQKLGGKITLASKVGKGSKFTLIFNYSPEEQKEYFIDQKIDQFLSKNKK